MQADFSVELGADDPVLSIPWTADDGQVRYYDLRRQPEMLLYIAEASRHAELGQFLATVNSRGSELQSAKCDAWFTTKLNEEEDVYGAACKAVGYVDLFFVPERLRFSFNAYEELAGDLTRLLKLAPEISAAAEFIIRRCYFGADDQAADVSEGFYVTFYASGYGDEEAEAWQRWGIAMKLVENAILQISAQRSRAMPPR